MFKNAKGFILGFLSCAIIFTLALTVFAAPVEKTVKAIYNDIKIKINGKELIPKDENGKTVEPFQVDGTVYLPVKAVSEAFGMDAEWDQDTQTVLLSGTPKLSGSEVFFVNEPDDTTYTIPSDSGEISGTASDILSAASESDIIYMVYFNSADPEVKAAAKKFVLTNKFSSVYFKTAEEAGKELPFTPKVLNYIPEGYLFYDVRALKDGDGNYSNDCWIRYISDKVKKADNTTPAAISLTATYVGENATVHVTTNQYFEHITLKGGVEALLTITGRKSDEQKTYTCDIIWIKDGVAYSLGSSYFDRDEMIKMAESAN